MPIEVLMPALSPTMEEGTLARWLVREGDSVSSGDLLAEIETDKATMEFEAVDEGTVGQILVAEGSEGVRVGTAIAVILAEGESANALNERSASQGTIVKENRETEQKAPADQPEPKVSGPAGNRIFASPLARRIAMENGLDLAEIRGSGPRGRIIKSDIEKALASTSSSGERVTAAKTTPPTAAISPSEISASILKMYADREKSEVPLDGMRKTIAARLTEAKQTIPHFYLRREIRIDPLLEFRSTINKSLEGRNIKISVNDFIIKACALALQEVPEANSVWAGDRVLRLKPSDVAVAVAIEGGLFTPVLRDAEVKSISALSTEMKDLAKRAKERKLQPTEYQGGSFAISNLGMFGIENFDAVINPPHSGILAVGAGMKKPVVGADGTLETATLMSVTLSADHRIIDGAVGAEFLGAIAQNLENPITMLA